MTPLRSPPSASIIAHCPFRSLSFNSAHSPFLLLSFDECFNGPPFVCHECARLLFYSCLCNPFTILSPFAFSHFRHPAKLRHSLSGRPFLCKSGAQKGYSCSTGVHRQSSFGFIQIYFSVLSFTLYFIFSFFPLRVILLYP